VALTYFLIQENFLCWKYF